MYNGTVTKACNNTIPHGGIFFQNGVTAVDFEDVTGDAGIDRVNAKICSLAGVCCRVGGGVSSSPVVRLYGKKHAPRCENDLATLSSSLSSGQEVFS